MTMPGAFVRARNTGFSGSGAGAGADVFSSAAGRTVGGFGTRGAADACAAGCSFCAAGRTILGCASAIFPDKDSLRTGFWARPSSACTAARSSSPTALNMFFTL